MPETIGLNDQEQRRSGNPFMIFVDTGVSFSLPELLPRAARAMEQRRRTFGLN